MRHHEGKSTSNFECVLCTVYVYKLLLFNVNNNLLSIVREKPSVV